MLLAFMKFIKDINNYTHPFMRFLRSKFYTRLIIPSFIFIIIIFV